MAYVNLKDVAKEAYAHIEKKELPQAEAKLNYLLNTYPNEPSFYYYLGCMYYAKKQWAMSVMAFDRAILLNPQLDEAWNNAASATRNLGDIEKCKVYFDKACELARAPGYKADDLERAKRNLADYIANYGSCWVASGEPTTAITNISEALAIYPKLPNAMWNIGLAYLEAGDYEKGFEGYDYGDRIGPDKERSYHGAPMSTPVWDGTKGQTIVVYGEQGIGDEIMFASCLHDVMCDANVILECHPRLMDLFRQSFPGLTVFGTRKADQVPWAHNYKIGAKIAIGSLPGLYRKTVDDFPGTPYLRASAPLMDKMRDKLVAISPRRKIGISWKGGIGITNKVPRCIPLETLKPLFDLDADFISLQYHSNARAEIDAFHEALGCEVITHWQDVVDDYDQTAALLCNLDLVISVPQSVVHLAGSLGVATIQMCPKRALWQMGPYGCDAPWYECVKNIWQLEDGNWGTVVANVVNLLEHEGY